MKLDKVTQEFVDNHKRYCSNVTIKWWQGLMYIIIIALFTFMIVYRWDISLCLITFYFAFWYLMSAFFKGLAVLFSLLGFGERKIDISEIEALNEKDLPVFTILIPLYKEANIADKIIRSMDSLDYPKDKMDIKLLLEADDSATINAVNSCDLSDAYDVIIVPDFQPKTKPRACNFGLKRAKGKYCVIYDAEDRPDVDQLKKVAILFKRLPEKFACVQAKLNYYNSMQNILTRWFTIEYSTLFDLVLPGLEILNIPIPLGGTSNHFRTEILKKIGGWDPFNVTEDCDLGIRIYTKGYRTCLLDSTTWEEANSELWNWIRQRSRWVKGFMQTHLTHTRNPFRTLIELGPWGMLGFYMCVGGSSFMLIINIIYWIVGGFYLLLLGNGIMQGQTLISMIVGPHIENTYRGLEILGYNFKAWPLIYRGADQDSFWASLSIVFFTIGSVLILANFMFVGTHIMACFKRKLYKLLPAALLMPFYWVLMSVGAWKGFIQLITKPFYWEKTNHGLADHVNHKLGMKNSENVNITEKEIGANE
jgi:cellulose synthase/poly-beta-1,6-N-acetylglucosamine synthase-like glycosyltransferase